MEYHLEIQNEPRLVLDPTNTYTVICKPKNQDTPHLKCSFDVIPAMTRDHLRKFIVAEIFTKEDRAKLEHDHPDYLKHIQLFYRNFQIGEGSIVQIFAHIEAMNSCV